MKVLLKLILLSIPIFCFSQQEICVYNNFEILGNDTINLMSNNIKEGLWVDYETLSVSTACFTSNECYLKKSIRYIKSKGEYSKGKMVGEWFYYYDTEALKKINQYAENGKQIGTSFEYFKNGNIKSQQKWNNDQLESQIVFFENGNKKFESYFENQSLKSFIIYYESSELKYTGENVKDWKIEHLHYFDKNGQEKMISPKKLGELLSDEGLIEYL